MEAICKSLRRWTTPKGRVLVEDDAEGGIKVEACHLTREETMLLEKILGDIIRDWGSET